MFSVAELGQTPPTPEAVGCMVLELLVQVSSDEMRSGSKRRKVIRVREKGLGKVLG